MQPAEAAGVYGPGCNVRGWAPVNVPHNTIDGHAFVSCHRRKPSNRIEITYTIERYDHAETASGVPVKWVTRTFRNVQTTSSGTMISWRCKPGEWGYYELWADAKIFDPPRTTSNTHWESVRVHLACPGPLKRSSSSEAPSNVQLYRLPGGVIPGSTIPGFMFELNSFELTKFFIII
ncbi:hypothetical protein COU91_00655 [Candidatus Saccharibacteria bacterium CG10_big_fil_rev_8_21_14_0_10_47_8]|nr:MAG: hypothetical protein COU91_00655 [Candidatus Saccharibacteria bacterium CG10_big_fil_rev_8_21_14_0_10_47_8]